MSSISSALNTINTSLLNEIQTYRAKSGTTAAEQSGSTSGSKARDRVDFSKVSELFKELQQLQSSDPAEFKQVLTDAATQFQDAAKQQTDPKAAAFLNKLADQFQKAADTGDISALQPVQGSDGGAKGAYGPRGLHHGRGHHHPKPPADDDDSAAAAATTSTSAATSTTSVTNTFTGTSALNTTEDPISLAKFDPQSLILNTLNTATQKQSAIGNVLGSFLTSAL